MNQIERTADLLSRFPSIGKKTALRLVFFLLKEPKTFSQQLGKTLQVLHDHISPCNTCGNLTDQNPCEICSDPRRDISQLCVVAYPQDILSLENSQSFYGVYHVLGGLISPLDGIGPDQLTIAQLKMRINNEYIREVILATSPTIEGESTARYIAKLCRNDDCTFSRIAQGMPMGGNFEYTDKHTIALALNSRTSLLQ